MPRRFVSTLVLLSVMLNAWLLYRISRLGDEALYYRGVIGATAEQIGIGMNGSNFTRSLVLLKKTDNIDYLYVAMLDWDSFTNIANSYYGLTASLQNGPPLDKKVPDYHVGPQMRKYLQFLKLKMLYFEGRLRPEDKEKLQAIIDYFATIRDYSEKVRGRSLWNRIDNTLGIVDFGYFRNNFENLDKIVRLEIPASFKGDIMEARPTISKEKALQKMRQQLMFVINIKSRIYILLQRLYNISINYSSQG